MGQNHGSMNQRPRAELLYEMVCIGNVEAGKALCREGASLEWIDREGRTPLIVACMNPLLVGVAKTLIELGANVNAYCPGRQAGTALHHAAKRGLEPSVWLLLSHGANAVVRNDDCQTPLDVARTEGHVNIVRIIENQVCYFSGWLREFYGPGFLEALVPQLLSRKIWAVVLPFGSRDSTLPLKMELIIYSTLQDAQPQSVIALWKAKIEEPKFQQTDPALIIFDPAARTRYKLVSGIEGDKQQLQRLYNACIGIPQVMPTQVLYNTPSSTPASASETAAEAVEPATVTNASDQSAAADSPLPPNIHQTSEPINTNGWGDSSGNGSHNGWGTTVGNTLVVDTSSSGWMVNPSKDDYNGWGVPDSGPSQHLQTNGSVSSVVPTNNGDSTSVSSASVPSAPPVPEEAVEEGPICYPSIDFSPVEWSVPPLENGASDMKDEGSSSSCVICWEAPIEGACIPCGHMAGCMICLNEIKAKNGPCPVCRAKINQIVRLYAV